MIDTMIDLRGIAQKLLDDLELEAGDLLKARVGVKLLYERIAEATTEAANRGKESRGLETEAGTAAPETADPQRPAAE